MAAGLVAVSGAPAAAQCLVHVVIVNARVHTVDPAKPTAEAVAICGERIGHVGTNEEVRKLAGPNARVIDAAGKLLLPGFNDAHVHLVRGAEEIVGVDLRPAKTPQEFAQRIGAHAKTLPKGEWILGGYWDHEAWPDKALPTREMIDAVTPDNPVFVNRLDGHMGLANSLALKLAKVGREVQTPDGGAIVRDAKGELTGVFKDNAMALITNTVPDPTVEQLLPKIRAALKHAASLGVTTIQDMTASQTEMSAYTKLFVTGELTARIYSIQNFPFDGKGPADMRLRVITNQDPGPATEHRDEQYWFRTGGLKLFADGSMGSGTAAFFEPYADDPKTSGLLLQSPEALEKAIFEADAAGFQLVVHAIGDRANAVVLDAFETLQKQRGRRDRRPRIEHAQVVRQEDKARLRQLGAIASIQPSHCIDDMRWAEARIGRDRSAISYNFKSFVDAGARVAFGTDWFVEPLNPMLGLYAAVTRQFPDGTPAGGWFPEERITMEQAVEFYTMGSAHAEFTETHKGSITEGKLADLVILSRDIFKVPPREILDTRPVLTMVGGRIVHESR
jgi:predicted amidohydrolase YtcJ